VTRRRSDRTRIWIVDGRRRHWKWRVSGRGLPDHLFERSFLAPSVLMRRVDTIKVAAPAPPIWLRLKNRWRELVWRAATRYGAWVTVRDAAVFRGQVAECCTATCVPFTAKAPAWTGLQCLSSRPSWQVCWP